MTLTVTMQEGGSYELHEESEWYEGVLVDIQEAEDRGFGPGLKWIVNLDGETDPFNDEPRETWAFSSQKLSPRSKLFKWAKGVLGETAMPDPGGSLELSKMIGARVKVMFEHVPGTDDAGQATTRERVIAIKAAGTTSPPATAPTVGDAPEPF